MELLHQILYSAIREYHFGKYDKSDSVKLRHKWGCYFLSVISFNDLSFNSHTHFDYKIHLSKKIRKDIIAYIHIKILNFHSIPKYK